MLSSLQSCFVVGAALLAAALLVAALNRLWPAISRKLVNDVTGWQLGILGTTYGVILGFMLSTAWSGFRAAEIDATLEATSALNVFRISDGLPDPQRHAMRTLATRYAQVTIEQEWPAMSNDLPSNAGSIVLSKMWQTLASTKAQTSGEINSVDHISVAMSNLSERRSMREQQRDAGLPGLMWTLLVVGGMTTVISSCLLGNDRKWLHYCQVTALTFVISVALAAIADLARPFQGAVAVRPLAFISIQQVMSDSQSATSTDYGIDHVRIPN